MDEGVQEVLFETRRHASRHYSSGYPTANRQLSEGVKRSFFSLLSTRGISQIKEKWSGNRHPRRLRKLISMFISPRGEHVAIAVGNQITILQKDDDFQEPCGLFTCGSSSAFLYGTWSEEHDILGVAASDDTVYFIKANGEEITRITKRHMKVSLPIISLIVQGNSDAKKSCLCTFGLLVSDGSIHDIEISHDPSSSLFSPCTISNGSTTKKQLFPYVFCLDYNQQMRLLAIVSGVNSILSTSNGPHCLSLWQKMGHFDLEFVISIEFDGLYSEQDSSVPPKLIISPQGDFISTLDVGGCLVTFKLDKEQRSISKHVYGESPHLQENSYTAAQGRQSLNDIVDFTWWSMHILIVAKMSGMIAFFDILRGIKLMESDPIYSLPILERVQFLPGQIFLLETRSFEEGFDSLDVKNENSLLEQVAADKSNQLDIGKLRWSLISFSGRSIPEMFDILISGRKYHAALDFANRHGLDEDEVLKSQWLHSQQGINEINMLLSSIQDQAFVLSECVERIGAKEDTVRALIACGLRLTEQYRLSKSEDDERIEIWDFRLARLKLLLFRDRLETFIGINMGRFSMEEYNRFRNAPINEAAIALAETGKIGALNLLFKRHPYSLAPFMLEVLAAIPETIPVQSYGQLLLGKSPPSSITLREEDWVECERMVMFIKKLPEDHLSRNQVRTEPLLRHLSGFLWPSTVELSKWYKYRARDMDTLSGQLDNSLCLVEFACRNGMCELEGIHEEISYLHQLTYSDLDEAETEFTMSLVAWEQLSDYERFKMMLKGVKEEKLVTRLHDKAIPFMRNRSNIVKPLTGDEVMDNNSTVDVMDGSFLVRWLREIALENKLDLCSMVIEEGCREFQNTGFFRNEAEAVSCALECIYLCSRTDRWSTMASILSKLPQIKDVEVESLRERQRLAECHIEAGRLMEFYQVPKPINFFMEVHSDGKGVKQILRLILSKFIRRQPGQTDNDWANLWRDLQSLQEKAFPFLDVEYTLTEFCRGLLKAGKFSLARNYLKGTDSIALATDKAENLVIQVAREYFFSASSLSCSEIWKAKECLSIFPSSRIVETEADIIDALTMKLPSLGVNLLPMQYRQIKDPMEVMKLAITSQAGAYLNVDELVEIAKLLGLNSQDDISAVQEVIAREAAVTGDLHLAFDLCLALAKKGHGSIWDLCAALARGPSLENMDTSSRKQLLGFALSHCDEESIGELLPAWKDLDMQGQCETLIMLTGRDPRKHSVFGSSIISNPFNSTQDMVDVRDWSGQVDDASYDDEVHFNNIKNILSAVSKNLPVENGLDLESLLRENGKILSFAALQLPWLLELSQDEENGKKFIPTVSEKQCASIQTLAIVTLLSWLARNGFAPEDNLIASLAKSVMEPPIGEEEDIIALSFMLNLVDAFHGVEIIEEQARTREEYNEICSIMNIGMIYSLLHNSGDKCESPSQRRELLLRKFQQRHTSLSSDARDKIDDSQSSFWREWKSRLEEQKCLADHSRVLEQIIPGVETARFLAGDIKYMESTISSLIESLRLEKKQILKDLLKLACKYNLDHYKVLLQYLGSVLVSEVWTIDDIVDEISEFKGEILAYAPEAIKAISLSIYPAIDGHDKQRIAFIYGLLADCYVHLENSEVSLPSPLIETDEAHICGTKLAPFYRIMEQECCRVAFIKDLNFKNIAGLQGLNFKCFRNEIYAHIDDYYIEALAEMVKILVSIYGDQVPEGLMSWQHVYRHHVLCLLTSLEERAKDETSFRHPETLHCLINQLEQTYDICRKYINFMAYPDVLDIIKRFFIVILPHNSSTGNLVGDLTWQDCLIILLNFWIRLADDILVFESNESSEEHFCQDYLPTCLKTFLSLVVEGKVSPVQGWGTVAGYFEHDIFAGATVGIFNFCREMIFLGCGFEAITDVFSQTISHLSTNNLIYVDGVQDVAHLYLSILETILQDLAGGSLEHQNLHCLFSSLSKLEGNLDDLRRVRRAVWERMTKFSDNLQIPSHVRVHALELMQFIATANKNLAGFSTELQANLLPWEGWDSLQNTFGESDSASSHRMPSITDGPNTFTNTLVALKSSQLVSSISPSTEITPDDLLTVETAVSCFVEVSKAAISESHLDVLLAILREWEGLFIRGNYETEHPEASNSGNDWNNDDWDEGWESFQEDLVEKEVKKENSLSVHPLHACWMEIFKQLIILSRSRDLLKHIDQSKTNNSGVLLDENDAHSLSQLLLGVDCYLALKMALLLPYEALRVKCLDAVEEKLNQAGVSDAIGGDHEFFVLILSSGILSTVITRSSYGNIFSCVCYMVGKLSRNYQEAHLSSLRFHGRNELEDEERKQLLLLRRIIFPYFISELVKAEQQILAGFLVTKFMHTNASLSLLNVADSNLRIFLGRELQELKVDELHFEKENSPEPLVNTISCLRSKLGNLIESALTLLPPSVGL